MAAGLGTYLVILLVFTFAVPNISWTGHLGGLARFPGPEVALGAAEDRTEIEVPGRVAQVQATLDRVARLTVEAVPAAVG